MIQTGIQLVGIIAVVAGIVLLWGVPTALLVAGALAIVVPEVRALLAGQDVEGEDDE